MPTQSASHDDPAPAGTQTGHPLLVPVDFSSCSSAALQFAIHFNRCVNAPLLVLHVIHESVKQAGHYRSNGTGSTLRPVSDIARDMLGDFVNEVCASCGDAANPNQPRLLLVNGLPAHRIQEIALRERAGLIIMGTHARSGLARLATGSVAAEVMRLCEIPVTIVKAARAGTSDAHKSVQSSDWWFDSPDQGLKQETAGQQESRLAG